MDLDKVRKGTGELSEKGEGSIDKGQRVDVEVLEESYGEKERRIVRKLDMTLMPMIFILYLFNYLDRNNISQAKLDMFTQELGLQGNDSSTAVSIVNVSMRRDAVSTHEDSSSFRHGLKLAVTDALIMCSSQTSYGFTYFYPSIVDGFNRTVTLACIAPRYIVAALISYGMAWSSKERGFHIMLTVMIAIVGFILSVATLGIPVRYVASFLLVAGAFEASPVIFSWAARWVGNVWSPYFFNDNDASQYSIAMALLMAFSALETALCGLMQWLLSQEDAKNIVRKDQSSGWWLYALTTPRCRRCRYRKLKCSRTEPCQSCLSANQNCEYRETDLKRRAEYTSSLERRVAWLETFIRDLHAASPDERDRQLSSAVAKDTLSTIVSPPRHDLDSHPSNTEYRGGSLQRSPDGLFLYHGPTGIYSSWPSCTIGSALDYLVSTVPLKLITGIYGINVQNETIIYGLFCRWQYPYSMFIYREAFLRDHFIDPKNCKYWSPDLLLAVCALGLQMSSDPSERELGDRCYTAAESVCTVSGLPNPSILTVQTFLCLAFYALSKGYLSKSWGLSGIAFRMTQDLGFHKDPRHWMIHDLLIITTEDIEIRRQIYRGCYTSDKLISLILGRSVQLPWQDASVELTEILPYVQPCSGSSSARLISTVTSRR
ncbi:hypothetical protein ANOM_010137 [Aspergillus nomiae NRRL 13137]|uniref:Zn(2)-C6 fungal-type domain-containing protein n=1 Tax=Aspergillus nomiae NRRL (strain ATCC 15546 / NRRL 13137 / CBS 260.88 / M93) TaxID=1509407 RepID=A0A0L1IQG1_ASPN3|nr:uncharacterized protein ANOM_010137 [Aspergillus nomiae NRRL 13137]KNG81610.1 hypothetical protein ANOM_010137 [Aspergillus nomiae NRRL 13137]